jgi:head-tail adaptor
MAIGSLRERVAFEARPMVDDGYGNKQSGDFAERYRCAAEIKPKLGTETVLAARLSGVQPMLITVRVCQALADFGTDWRIRDVRKDIVYDVKAISNPDMKRQYLEILAVSGVAT